MDYIYRLRSKYHGHNLPGVSDVKYVIKHIERRFKNKCHRFIISSDSKPYCQEHYTGEHTVISPFEDDLDDFAVLASCDHIVITHGTFGWWAAWMVHQKGGSVYYFKYPYLPNTRHGNLYKASDVYLPDWIPYTNVSVGTGKI